MCVWGGGGGEVRGWEPCRKGGSKVGEGVMGDGRKWEF